MVTADYCQRILDLDCFAASHWLPDHSAGFISKPTWTCMPSRYFSVLCMRMKLPGLSDPPHCTWCAMLLVFFSSEQDVSARDPSVANDQAPYTSLCTTSGDGVIDQKTHAGTQGQQLKRRAGVTPVLDLGQGGICSKDAEIVWTAARRPGRLCCCCSGRDTVAPLLPFVLHTDAPEQGPAAGIWSFSAWSDGLSADGSCQIEAVLEGKGGGFLLLTGPCCDVREHCIPRCTVR